MQPISRNNAVFTFALILALCTAAACEDATPPLEEAIVIMTSPDPDRVASTTPSFVGRVVDFITDEPIPDAIISTFPPTTILRTNALGEFVLTEDIFPGRFYEIRAEANGYTPSILPLRAEANKSEPLTFPLVPTARAMPVRVEPAVLVFSPDAHARTASLVNDANAPLEITLEAPPWLRTAELTRLTPGERRELLFQLDPAALQEALAALPEGAVLQSRVVLRDAFDRVSLLHALVIPAAADTLTLELLGPADFALRVGQSANLQLRARYLDVPLTGALLSVAVEPDVDDAPIAADAEATTDAQGLATLPFQALRRGDATLTLRLPTAPDLPPLEARVHVRPASPCSTDADGLNACGDPALWTCAEDERGDAICTDLDECAVDLRGNNTCGDAARWSCTNAVGAPSRCEDIDECEDENGGCGEEAQVQCVNQAGLPPSCRARSGCTPDANGQNDCGLAARWTCIPGEDGQVDCIDLDECTIDNGGCGDPRFWTCINTTGLPPRCEDRDECEPDAEGNNVCGDAQRWRCVNRPGAEPTCQDIDECEPGDDGTNACGAPAFWTCMNREGLAPVCNDLNECTPDAGGNNACGVASRWSCTNNNGAPPDCADIDECEPDPAGMNACGVASRWACTNRLDRAPSCEDLDECAPDANGMNACGLASRWTCTNNPGAPASCADLDECAINNGGCGPTTAARCINNTGAPPTCQPLDRCTPDQDGNSTCGPAHLFECFDPGPQGTPTCLDRDECAPGDDGRNACGDARFWTCTNNIAAPPTCADIDECNTNNGACGDPAFVRCTNQLNAAPRCADLDECATDNGGCGPALTRRCINRVNAPPLCEDIDQCEPDANGQNTCGDADQWICSDAAEVEPTCEDLDDCRVVNDRNTCGLATDTLCTNNTGAPATCQRCEAGTANLDNDPTTGCEYACDPGGAEQCNSRDDDCDGSFDEGFDLRSNIQHCGSCGNACATLPNTDATCALGTCLPIRCHTGFRDLNGDPADGCEDAIPGATLYVNATNTQPNPDGSADNPFRTLTAALAVVQPGQRIFIHAGAYAGNTTVYNSDITIEGEGRNLVTFTASPAQVNLAIHGSNVTLAHITFVGGRTGVLVSGNPSRSTSVHLHDIAISGIQASNSGDTLAGIPAYGVLVQNSQAFSLTRSSITGVHGGDGDRGTTSTTTISAGSGHGVHITDTFGCRIQGNTIDQITGGIGHYVLQNTSQPRYPGLGGHAFGIRLNNTSGCLVDANAIRTLTGGPGGPSLQNHSNSTIGGVAAGIQLDAASANNTVQDNTIAQLVGGEGGDVLATSTQPGAPGNIAAGIRLVDARFTTLARNSVQLVRGGHSTNDGTRNAAGPTWAVDLVRAPDTTLTWLDAWKLNASLGATRPTAACVHVNDAANLTLAHLTCHDIARNSTATAAGVHIPTAQTSPFTVKNSIFSAVAGPAVRNLATPNTANVAFVTAFACADPPFVNATLSGFTFTDDPRFVDPDLGDLHLLPTSPAIDSADPNDPFDLEPAPNGCRANLGAFGQTPFATPAPEADHCP